MKQTKIRKRRPSRLDYIERKIDRILSELLIIRCQSRRSEIDDTIDNLHRTAHSLAEQCRREREAAERMITSCVRR